MMVRFMDVDHFWQQMISEFSIIQHRGDDGDDTEWPGDRIQEAFALLQSGSIIQDELLQLKATAQQLGHTEDSKSWNTLPIL